MDIMQKTATQSDFDALFEVTMIKIDHLAERMAKYSSDQERGLNKLQEKIDSVHNKLEVYRNELVEKIHKSEIDYHDGMKALWIKVAALGAGSSILMSLVGSLLLKHFAK